MSVKARLTSINQKKFTVLGNWRAIFRYAFPSRIQFSRRRIYRAPPWRIQSSLSLLDDLTRFTVNQLYLAAIKFGVQAKVDLFGALKFSVLRTTLKIHSPKIYVQLNQRALNGTLHVFQVENPLKFICQKMDSIDIQLWNIFLNISYSSLSLWFITIIMKETESSVFIDTVW